MPIPTVRIPWEATWWVEFLEKFGPAFPSPDASHDTWNHFIAESGAAPIAVIFVGFLLSLGLLCGACCGCRCCASARSPSRRISSKPTALLGLLTLILIAIGTIIYGATGSQASETATQQLDRAALDADAAASIGSQLKATGNVLLADLNALVPACPDQYKPLAQQFVNSVQPKVAEFSQQTRNFVTALGPIPDQIRSVKDKSQYVTVVTLVGLLVPLGLVLLGSLVLVLAVCMSNTGRCTGAFIRCLSPVFFVPTVLIIAIAAATQLEVGIVTSSFCVNVDANSLAWIAHLAGTESVSYQLSNYYIAGVGNNPLLQDLSDASTQLTQAQQSFAAAKPFEANCPSWGKYEDVMGALTSAQASITSGSNLLSTDNIYPYYQQAVREDICKTVVIGLGWLTLFQILAGLICLPCLTCTANDYLKDRASQIRSTGVTEALRPYATSV